MSFGRVSGQWLCLHLGSISPLIPTELNIDRLLDNLSVDEEGALWAAGVPSAVRWLSALRDPAQVAPSSALRITKNIGGNAYFGEKLKVEKV